MLEFLHHFLKDKHFTGTCWLAYSGGLDSQVLLRLCVELREHYPFSFHAIHVHHGLSPQADAWMRHCERSCAELQVPFHGQRVDARPPAGESVESYAREQRYTALRERLQPGDILLMAHHQDDQAETLLLQLLRGAGLKGLSAMPKIKTFGPGFLLRPLLEHRRAELQAYASRVGLSWVEDELNQDPRYSRNFIRQRVFPLLQQRWPAAAKTLARSAGHCAEAEALLVEYADQDLAQAAGSKAGTLSCKRLLAFSPARQRFVLRRWFEAQGLLMPNTRKLYQLQRAVLLARPDSQPLLVWGGMELRRYQDQLYLTAPLPPHCPASVYHWQLRQPLLIPGIGSLKAVPRLGQGLHPRIQTVQVRFRQGGEFYFSKGGKHRALKKFFQEQAIPPWERERLPLLFAEEELIAIPGYFLASTFQAAPQEAGWVLDFSIT